MDGILYKVFFNRDVVKKYTNGRWSTRALHRNRSEGISEERNERTREQQKQKKLCSSWNQYFVRRILSQICSASKRYVDGTFDPAESAFGSSRLPFKPSIFKLRARPKDNPDDCHLLSELSTE
eukprot:GEMP01119556.1.p1 GENE.GEMP01119556.1~~GEMP01119556.1.p1  ORF type:complete len:123 (-),score=7.71 GEMP01119556.1:52-420(-)